MKYLNRFLIYLPLVVVLLNSCVNTKQANKPLNTEKMIIRISEIEIYPDYLQEYNSILKEESEASVRLEPGVISIYPMYKKDNPTQVRILEMYANRNAYE